MTDSRPPPPEEGVNVNVILRCRPPNAQELAERNTHVIQCNDALREVTLYQSVGGKQMSRTFRYDKVFGPDSKQERVYKQAIVPIVQEVLDGFNCTIFAYGQTGTGKTYTMEGGPRNSVDGSNLSAEAGVIPRAIKQIFDAIECNQVTDSSVKVSFLELYNEELTDLLSPGAGGGGGGGGGGDDKDRRLRLLEDRSGVVVQGLEEVVVKNAAEIYQVLDRGTSKRRTAETLLNKRSSRSHSVFTVTIHMKETTPEGEDVIKIGKLNLVDLAGSENISRSGAKDGRAREAGNINQSLLTLGRVITALVEHSGHVPYRDSKLTRLLRDSLGGKTKTCIIATIAPSVVCLEETVSTLDYAHRAKNIRNRPELNQRISKTTMIKELTTEIDRLKLDLVATREKNGIFVSVERYEANELERVQLREAAAKHKAELEALAAEHAEELNAMTAAHETELVVAARRATELERQLEEARGDLERAQLTIQESRFVILSHQRAEQAIAAHAAHLTSELGGTAAELGDVFGRLEAALELTGGDRAVLRGACELAGTKLAQLRSHVAAAAEAQGDALRGMQAQVGEFQLRKQEELSALGGQLQRMQGRIAAMEEALGGALRQHASAAASALDGAASGAAGAAQDMGRALQAAGESMGAALGALAASLQAQGGQLARFAQEQQTAAAEAQAAAAGGFARARESVAGIGASVQRLGCMSDAAAAAASDRLASFATEFEASMAKKQQALLSQVAGLLADFAAERGQEVAAAVAGVTQQLVDGRQQLAAAAASAAAAADACASALEADAGSSDQAARAMQSSLRGGLGQATTELAGSCGGVQAVTEQLGKHCQDMNARLQQQVKSVGALASDGAARVAEQGRRAGEQLAAAAGELQADGQALAAAAQEAHAADAALASSLASTVGAADKASADAAAEQAGQLADVAGQLTSSASAQLAKQPPALPAQRRVEVPEAELVGQLCCPPELVLVEHFRVQRKQILERGGDPVEVFGLLAPVAPEDEPGAQQGNEDEPGSSGGEGAEENDAPAPPSPASSVRSTRSLAPPEGAAAAPAAAGKRSRIPTLGAAARSGLADRTNIG